MSYRHRVSGDHIPSLSVVYFAVISIVTRRCRVAIGVALHGDADQEENTEGKGEA
jgi:hypothetical protein